MRISDRQTARDYLKYLDKAKTNYAETNLRIASGNRFTSIADDVSAATKALRIGVEKSKTEEYYGNVKAVNEQLSTTENALTSINGVLSSAHSKVLAAMNSTSGEAGRAALANEIGSVRDEVLQFANTTYNDAFVLGGTSSGKAPFSKDSSGNLLYNGSNVDDITYDNVTGKYFDTVKNIEVPMNGETYVDVGLGITMTGANVQSDTAMKTSYSGLEILGFGKDADGNPNNIYNILSKMKDSIANYDAQKVSTYDGKLTSFTTNFRGYLTDIGAKTSFLDTIEKRVSTQLDTYNSNINRLVGINDAEEATNQSMNDYVLKAVLSMGSKIIPVSLMDFLR
jgi:flagellar hook-associated protein 3 FlgL